MNRLLLLISLSLFTALSLASELKIGEPLPAVVVASKGQMVFDYSVENGRMVFKEGSAITWQPWDSSQLTGKIRCIYHLAARMGVADINQPFIDALIAAKLPEYVPDGRFKTTTILDTSDALWGTARLAGSQLEESQKRVPHAYYVNDTKGAARQAWGLAPGTSTVIVLDTEGRVLFFKEGALTEAEIHKSVEMIKRKLAALN